MKTLLFAEDDPHIQKLVEIALDGLDCRIEHHFDGSALLDHLIRGPIPDLVILDVNLPGISGFEVLRTMKQNDRVARVPVLMLSASTLETYRELARTLGAAHFLPKPFEISKLVSVVSGLLDPKPEAKPDLTAETKPTR